MAEKVRILSDTGFQYPETTWYDGEVQSPGGVYNPFSGIQRTVSIGHPIDRKTGRRIGGGPFYTSRLQASFETVDVDRAYSNSGKGTTYSGPCFIPLPTGSELKAADSQLAKQVSQLELDSDDLSHLDPIGATAIALCSPGSPQANLGQAIVETKRDGLPAIHGYRTWKSRALRLKNAGDEFLNHVFGWVPLVNDISDSAKVISHLDHEINRYQESEGTDTRRTFEFPSESSTTVVSTEDIAWARIPNFGSPSRNKFNGKWGRITLSRTTERRRWFVGSFTYALPSQTDSWKRVVGAGRQARDFLGLSLSPELLWEVTPWSWAADWFTNIGDVMTNVTSFGQYGMVMRYGYMMEETIRKVTKSLDHVCIDGPRIPGEGLFHTNLGLGPVSSSYESVTKRRAEANPFGFGIGWEGLSPLQLAITAALGITRLR